MCCWLWHQCTKEAEQQILFLCTDIQTFPLTSILQCLDSLIRTWLDSSQLPGCEWVSVTSPTCSVYNTTTVKMTLLFLKVSRWNIDQLINLFFIFFIFLKRQQIPQTDKSVPIFGFPTLSVDFSNALFDCTDIIPTSMRCRTKIYITYVGF